MRIHTKPAAGQGGSLLLEVLISILIFSFAILGLVGLQAKAFGFAGDAEDRNKAAALADDIVAIMWAKQSTDWLGTLATDVTAWRTRVQAALPPYDTTNVKADVADDTDFPGVVDITITWQPADNRKPADGTYLSARRYQTKVVMP